MLITETVTDDIHTIFIFLYLNPVQFLTHLNCLRSPVHNLVLHHEAYAKFLTWYVLCKVGDLCTSWSLTGFDRNLSSSGARKSSRRGNTLTGSELSAVELLLKLAGRFELHVAASFVNGTKSCLRKLQTVLLSLQYFISWTCLMYKICISLTIKEYFKSDVNTPD